MVAVNSNLLSSYYTANLPASLFYQQALLKNFWKKRHFLASASRAFLLLMQAFSVLPFFSAPFFLWHMSTLFSHHLGAAHTHIVTDVRVGPKRRTHCGIKSPCSFQVRKHRYRQNTWSRNRQVDWKQVSVQGQEWTMLETLSTLTSTPTQAHLGSTKCGIDLWGSRELGLPLLLTT